MYLCQLLICISMKKVGFRTLPVSKSVADKSPKVMGKTKTTNIMIKDSYFNLHLIFQVGCICNKLFQLVALMYFALKNSCFSH